MDFDYNRLITRTFEDIVEQVPEKQAVLSDKLTLTYQELNTWANQIAHKLHQMEIGTKNNIGVFLERTPLLVATLLGILKSGNTYVPLDPMHPVDRIKLIIEDSKPALIISEPEISAKLPSDIGLLVLDRRLLREKSQTALNPDLEIDPESLAYVIFTSGSTGRPKGVMIPQRALSNFIYSMSIKPGITKNDRLLAVATVTFDMSVLDLFLPLIKGASVVLLDSQYAKDPSKIIQSLEKRECTILQATPTTWQMLLDYGWKGKEDLTALTGGEALTLELADALLDRCKQVWNMYGPTETTVYSAISLVQRRLSISIGTPIYNTDIFLLDSEMRPVAKGETGELYIGGVGLADGYYGRRDLTEEVFVNSPFDSKKRLYRTGDIIKLMEDGRFEYLGRDDFQVKIRGFRIELGEIEKHILMMEGVQKALVHAQELYKGQKDLVAYIIPKKDPITVSDIRHFLSKKIPDYMIPSYLVIMEVFPLNTNNKIDRKALPLPSQIARFKNPQNLNLDNMTLEEKLQIKWSSVLHQDEIGMHDNFFNIGGNSILAVKLVSEINRLINIKLPLGTFFQFPSISEIKTIIERGEFNGYETVIPLQIKGNKNPLLCLGGIDLYRPLAESMGKERPIYAVFIPYEQQLIEHIQNNTLDQSENLSIEGIASGYLKSIKEAQSEGPYNLLGVSIAGIIAFDIARRLIASGEEVNSLFFLDSHLPSAIENKVKYKLFETLRKTKNSYRTIFKGIRRRVARHNLTLDDIANIRDEIHFNALVEFDQNTTVYSGNACLIKAMDKQYRKGESYQIDLGWRKRIGGELEIYEVPGTHVGMLQTPYAQDLAEKISSYFWKHEIK